MVKRGLAIALILSFVCLCFGYNSALAASTTEAKDPISVYSDCDLTLTYTADGTAASNSLVKIYKVASVSEDFVYTLESAFLGSSLSVNGIQTNSEWDRIRSTIEVYVLVNDIEPTASGFTDQFGSVCFTKLEPGLYFVTGVECSDGSITYSFDSALIVLPGLDFEGVWQYQITVAAKPSVLPPVKPDAVEEFKVIKLWQDDGDGKTRPEFVEVDIYRNGSIAETVILSNENNWSYSWLAKADGSRWMVSEKTVPDGYVMTLWERSGTFVITNSLLSDEPDNPKVDDDPYREEEPGFEDSDSPYTGDTSNMLLYTVLMFASGAVLILLSITGKKKRYEDK